MSGYTKLFNSILASTIWEADMPTRIVWITMLAMKDKRGIVEGSVPGLATLARVPVAQVRQALENLKAPDRDSRTKVDEGRRIREVEGGWFVINHGKFRDMLGAEERREYLRQKQAESRARRASTKVNMSTVDIDKSTESTHTDPYTDPDPNTKNVRTSITESASRRRVTSVTDAAPSALEVSFRAFWSSYPRKVGRIAAWKAWRKISPANGLTERISAALLEQIQSDQWQRDHGQFIPHPATWLNQGRWDDEPTREPEQFIPIEPPAIDWFEECKVIHAGACGLDRYKHAMRIRTEAIKA